MEHRPTTERWNDPSSLPFQQSPIYIGLYKSSQNDSRGLKRTTGEKKPSLNHDNKNIQILGRKDLVGISRQRLEKEMGKRKSKRRDQKGVVGQSGRPRQSVERNQVRKPKFPQRIQSIGATNIHLNIPKRKQSIIKMATVCARSLITSFAAETSGQPSPDFG